MLYLNYMYLLIVKSFRSLRERRYISVYDYDYDYYDYYDDDDDYYYYYKLRPCKLVHEEKKMNC